MPPSSIRQTPPASFAPTLCESNATTQTSIAKFHDVWRVGGALSATGQ